MSSPSITVSSARSLTVQVLGAGPAGLYAAVLLKKTHPDWSITVTERNPRGATYGWGVVFSDRTLTSLREADYPTYTRITDSFVLWEAIDILFDDAALRCDGHAFAGIGRRLLLTILQERCAELGVEMAFDTEVEDALALDAPDVLIAADGANSRTRQDHAEWFGPRASAGEARYIWFGTDKVYDAFTFIFRNTEHGLFQVHAYPFDARTSTFIVECRAETLRNAGLEGASEQQSLAFCQALFADHLGPARLYSNRSQWLTFMTLHCRHWSHDNLVILGDAAHTAHFSIGSGTKLALEDAIALSNALDVATLAAADVPSALRQYELGRRPRVEATQRAASESQRYFEHVGRYANVAPPQFAFHLLTRSGRITYDNLAQRDPHFVARVSRWFEAQPRNGAEPLLLAPPPAFTPLQLRDLTLPNRLAAVTSALSDSNDTRGVGLLLSPQLAVAPDGRVTAHDELLATSEAAARWQRVAADVHATGGALALQLSHAGRRGATRPRAEGLDLPLRAGAWPLLAPSALPYGPRSQTPRAMTADDLEHVKQAFVNAAQLASDAHADLLTLNMAHGYLLGSFLSPLTNQRDDAWGGDAERRLRFPLDVLAATRAVWPTSQPLAVALNADDWARGGLRLPEAVVIARSLREHGCDLLIVQAGQTTYTSQPNFDFETLRSSLTCYAMKQRCRCWPRRM